jgi:hypothetical protein
MFRATEVSASARARFSRRLEGLAHFVFVLFVLLCIVPIWPLRILDPFWLLRLAYQILQFAGLVLMGIAMMELARKTAPWRRHLRARRALILSSVNMVAVGFLLLIPLQILPLKISELALVNILLLQSASSLGFQAVLQYLALVRASLALGYAILFFLAGRQLRDS